VAFPARQVLPDALKAFSRLFPMGNMMIKPTRPRKRSIGSSSNLLRGTRFASTLISSIRPKAQRQETFRLLIHP